MTKTELLEAIRTERAALDDVFVNLTSDELCAAILDGGWSMKDSLAHITAWERRLVREFARALRGETPDWPEPGATIRDTDRLNARDFDASRDSPLENVRDEAQHSYEDTLRLIESMPEERLFSPAPWSGSHPLYLLVRAHTDEHYREHLDAFEAWWSGEGS